MRSSLVQDLLTEIITILHRIPDISELKQSNETKQQLQQKAILTWPWEKFPCYCFLFYSWDSRAVLSAINKP